MFPGIVLGILVVFTLTMIIRAHSGMSEAIQGEEAANWTFMKNPRRLTLGVAAFVIYQLVIESIGFFTSSALLIICTSLLVGYRHRLTVLLSTIGFLAFIYVVFVALFDRPLPKEFFLTQASNCPVMTESGYG